MFSYSDDGTFELGAVQPSKVVITRHLTPPPRRLVVSNKNMRPVAGRPATPQAGVSSGAVWAIVGVVVLVAFGNRGGGSGSSSSAPSSLKGVKKGGKTFHVEAWSKHGEKDILPIMQYGARNKKAVRKMFAKDLREQGHRPQDFKLGVWAADE